MLTVKRYQFWVLSALALVVVLGSWMWSSMSLSKAIQTNASTIQGYNSKVDSLLGKQNPANPNFHDAQARIINETTRDVLAAWSIKQQKQANIELEWPQALGDDFIAAVKKLFPIEAKVNPTTREGLLKPEFLERYRDYIDEELPKLAETIDAAWKAQEASSEEKGVGAGGFGGFGGFGGRRPQAGEKKEAEAKDEVRHTVYWNPGNQAEIKQMFDWSDNADLRPTTLEVLYAQEDLWVLESLMGIIRRVNSDAAGQTEEGEARLVMLPPWKARIRQIDQILIGTPAIARWQEEGGGAMIAAKPGSEAEAEGGAAPPRRMMEAQASGVGEAAEGEVFEFRDPAEGRYLDMNYQPMSAQRLRTATGGGSQDANLAVAKRIPVWLDVQIDEREIDRLLVECGNAPLTVEVTYFEMLAKSAAPGGGSESSAAVRSSADESYNPYLRRLRLFGIISLYNEVSPESFGEETVEGQPAGPAASETPAPPAPAAPTPETPETPETPAPDAPGLAPAAAGP